MSGAEWFIPSVRCVCVTVCVFCSCKAQARCHRIGQSKAVKIYRLITRNSYEREMFDKASLKLGLDKAVLQSMSGRENAANGVRTGVSHTHVTAGADVYVLISLIKLS